LIKLMRLMSKEYDASLAGSSLIQGRRILIDASVDTDREGPARHTRGNQRFQDLLARMFAGCVCSPGIE
jgi:hypothetical protein